MAKFSRLKFLHTYIINSYFIGVKQTVSTKNSNGQNVWANLTSHSSNPNKLIDNELSKILQEIVVCQQNFLLDRQKTNHSNYSSVSSILVTILISAIQIPPIYNLILHCNQILGAGLQFCAVTIASLLDNFFVFQSVAKIHKPLSIVWLASQKILTIFFNILEMLKTTQDTHESCFQI